MTLNNLALKNCLNVCRFYRRNLLWKKDSNQSQIVYHDISPLPHVNLSRFCNIHSFYCLLQYIFPKFTLATVMIFYFVLEQSVSPHSNLSTQTFTGNFTISWNLKIESARLLFSICSYCIHRTLRFFVAIFFFTYETFCPFHLFYHVPIILSPFSWTRLVLIWHKRNLSSWRR